MSLNAVVTHVVTLLDGLTLHAYAQPLQASYGIPGTDEITTPRCYVWGTSDVDERSEAPRIMGFRRIMYEVGLYVYVADDPSLDATPRNFSILTDDIKTALKTATMPIFITDPDTGEQSQLITIGEKIERHVDIARTTADERFTRMLAYMVCTIEEKVVA